MVVPTATTECPLDRSSSPFRMVLIRNEENLGFTGGHNVAAGYALRRSAPADYVLLLNNDAAIDAPCLARMVAAGRQTNAGIVGAVVTDASGRAYFAGSGSFCYHLFRSLISRPVRARSEPFWDSPIAYGAAMLIGREVLDEICRRRGECLKDGLFAYGDEIEFCWAARREGFRTIIAGGALVSHDSARRSRRPRDARYFFYYSTRNNISIAREFLSLPSRIAFHLAYAPLCARRIVKRLIARQPHLARAIALGLLDGYQGVEGMWKLHDEAAG